MSNRRHRMSFVRRDTPEAAFFLAIARESWGAFGGVNCSVQGGALTSSPVRKIGQGKRSKEKQKRYSMELSLANESKVRIRIKRRRVADLAHELPVV